MRIVNERIKGVEERMRRLQKELAEVKGRYSQEVQALRMATKALRRRVDENSNACAGNAQEIN